MIGLRPGEVATLPFPQCRVLRSGNFSQPSPNRIPHVWKGPHIPCFRYNLAPCEPPAPHGGSLCHPNGALDLCCTAEPRGSQSPLRPIPGKFPPASNARGRGSPRTVNCVTL